MAAVRAHVSQVGRGSSWKEAAGGLTQTSIVEPLRHGMRGTLRRVARQVHALREIRISGAGRVVDGDAAAEIYDCVGRPAAKKLIRDAAQAYGAILSNGQVVRGLPCEAVTQILRAQAPLQLEVPPILIGARMRANKGQRRFQFVGNQLAPGKGQ